MAEKRSGLIDSFSVALDLGIRLAAPIIMFAYLGNYLSRRNGLGEGWTLFLIMFGLMSGIWNAYKMLARMAAKVPKPKPVKRRRIR